MKREEKQLVKSALIDDDIFDKVCKEVIAEQKQRHKNWIVASSNKVFNVNFSCLGDRAVQNNSQLKIDSLDDILMRAPSSILKLGGNDFRQHDNLSACTIRSEMAAKQYNNKFEVAVEEKNQASPQLQLISPKNASECATASIEPLSFPSWPGFEDSQISQNTPSLNSQRKVVPLFKSIRVCKKGSGTGIKSPAAKKRLHSQFKTQQVEISEKTESPFSQA